MKEIKEVMVPTLVCLSQTAPISNKEQTGLDVGLVGLDSYVEICLSFSEAALGLEECLMFFRLGLVAFPCRTSDPECKFLLGLLDIVGRTSGQED